MTLSIVGSIVLLAAFTAFIAFLAGQAFANRNRPEPIWCDRCGADLFDCKCTFHVDP